MAVDRCPRRCWQALLAGAALDHTPLVRVQRVPKAAFRDCQKQDSFHPDVHILRNLPAIRRSLGIGEVGEG
jgi:hypothetical protein